LVRPGVFVPWWQDPVSQQPAIQVNIQNF